MKKTRKLIVPIALLVLAVMAVTSTTFAWFTVNSTVSGGTYGARVLSSEDMLFIVSIKNSEDNTGGRASVVDPANWETNVSENLRGADYLSTYGGLRLADLTYLRAGATALKAGGSAAFAPVSDDGLYTKEGDLATKNGVGYLEFTYNFWHTGAGGDLNLEMSTSLLALTSANESVRSFGSPEYGYFASFFEEAIVSRANYADWMAAFRLNGNTTPVNDANGIPTYNPVTTPGSERYIDIVDQAIVSRYGIDDTPPTGAALTAYLTAGYEAFVSGTTATGFTTWYFNPGEIVDTGYDNNDIVGGAADPDDVRKFFGTTTAPTGSALQAYYNAGYSTFTDGTDDWYFKMGGTYTAKAEQAARVMFTSTNPLTTPVTTNKYLWNPHAGEGYDTTPFDVQDLYQLVQTAQYQTLPELSYDPYAAGGISMAGITTITGTSAIPITKFHDSTSGSTGTVANDPLATVVTRNGIDYYHASVIVTIWLEGWDSDCFNAILGADLTTLFTFST